MTKQSILIVFMLGLILQGYAQNGPQFTHYVFNQTFLNPGSAGITNKAFVQMNLKSQYLGYTATADQGGGILSSLLSLDLPSKILHGGVGLYIANNNFSKSQINQEIQVNYSYNKQIGVNVLGLGVSTGLFNKKLLGENFNPRDPNDPLVPISNLNMNAMNMNMGVFLFNPNYQIGLSIKNLLEPSFKINNTSETVKEVRQYLLTAKTNVAISYLIDVSPMILIKTDSKTVSTEIGMLVNFDQKYWTGLNYRFNDAASLIVGADMLNSNLKVGYALDLIVQGTQAKSAMSHEIFLRYVLNTPRFGKKMMVKTPRYSF